MFGYCFMRFLIESNQRQIVEFGLHSSQVCGKLMIKRRLCCDAEVVLHLPERQPVFAEPNLVASVQGLEGVLVEVGDSVDDSSSSVGWFDVTVHESIPSIQRLHLAFGPEHMSSCAETPTHSLVECGRHLNWNGRTICGPTIHE